MNKHLYDEAVARVRSYNARELEEAGFLNMDRQFFPAVHYPPITMYPDITQEELFSGYTLPDDKRFDLYVHFPFCAKCCNFCHYPVFTGASPAEKDVYIEALEKDIAAYMRILGVSRLAPRAILIGGGTPTYLSPDQLKRFLEMFGRRVDLGTATQFSYDVDPVTLLGPSGNERLRVLKDYGVHRLTIGVQSFDNVLLRAMNRHHNARAGADAVKAAKKAGFKVNVDFIYGYVGQTAESWADSMELAAALEPDEIQVYRLKFIPYGDHDGAIKNEFPRARQDYFERTMLMKSLTISILENGGYKENLRRVFSRTPQDYSHYAHNGCCGLRDQIGFGLTAYSSMRDRFGLNAMDLEDYYRRVNSGRMGLTRGLVRGKDDQERWAFILPLKNRKVVKRFFKRVTGSAAEDIFKDKLVRLKRFDLVSESDTAISLTDKGVFFADDVCHQFYSPQYVPFPRESYGSGILSPFNNP